MSGDYIPTNSDLGRNGVRYDLDSVRRGMSEFSERWNNPLRWSTFDFPKEYIGSRLTVLIQFDRMAMRDVCDVGERSAAADEGAVRHGDGSYSIGPKDGHFGEFARPNNGDQNSVLLRVVEQVQRVEDISFARGKYLQGFQHVSDRLTGCFYSVTRGFKTDPVIAGGQFEVVILRALIDSDQFPGHVIKGTSEIVNSVAYYQGEVGIRLFSEPNSNGEPPIIRVGLNTECVRIMLDEGRKLPFKVVDVMVGPFDF